MYASMQLIVQYALEITICTLIAMGLLVVYKTALLNMPLQPLLMELGNVHLALSIAWHAMTRIPVPNAFQLPKSSIMVNVFRQIASIVKHATS